MPARTLKVVISGAARLELEDIRAWIARDDAQRALSFVRELRGMIDDLTTEHGRYPRVDGPDHAPIRRMNYRHYRIFYQALAEQIIILHVHHGRRAMPVF